MWRGRGETAALSGGEGRRNVKGAQTLLETLAKTLEAAAEEAGKPAFQALAERHVSFHLEPLAEDLRFTVVILRGYTRPDWEPPKAWKVNVDV